VAGDARALFAERFLGDLHHDFLAGLQHFADELGPARAVTVAVMAVTAVLAMAAAGSATIKASTPASAVTAAISATVAATIGASASAAVSAAAAERPLEAGTGITADTRRLAWEFALRFLAGMR